MLARMESLKQELMQLANDCDVDLTITETGYCDTMSGVYVGNTEYVFPTPHDPRLPLHDYVPKRKDSFVLHASSDDGRKVTNLINAGFMESAAALISKFYGADNIDHTTLRIIPHGDDTKVIFKRKETIDVGESTTIAN